MAKHKVTSVCQSTKLGKQLDLSAVDDCVVDGVISGHDVEFTVDMPSKLIATIDPAIRGLRIPCKVSIKKGTVTVETE